MGFVTDFFSLQPSSLPSSTSSFKPSFEPSILASLMPSTCTPCDDEPTRGMKEKDKKCSEIPNIEERCGKNSWKDEKYCAQTCFNAGEPYEGMFCCSESPSVVPSTSSSSVQSVIPSSKPSLQPSSQPSSTSSLKPSFEPSILASLMPSTCTSCDDEPTRGMKEKDKKCS